MNDRCFDDGWDDQLEKSCDPGKPWGWEKIWRKRGKEGKREGGRKMGSRDRMEGKNQ